jgi:hypothetical protein
VFVNNVADGTITVLRLLVEIQRRSGGRQGLRLSADDRCVQPALSLELRLLALELRLLAGGTRNGSQLTRDQVLQVAGIGKRSAGIQIHQAIAALGTLEFGTGDACRVRHDNLAEGAVAIL